MGGVEAAKAGSAERLCATDATKAYKRGLALFGEGAYDKALTVSYALRCRRFLHGMYGKRSATQQAGSSLDRETTHNTEQRFVVVY